MRTLLSCVLLVAFCCPLGADDKKDEKIDAKKLVGKWKQYEPKDGIQVTVEYTADGKVNGTVVLENGDKLTCVGTYKLEGNKLTQTVAIGKQEAQETVGKVTRLTDDEFEMTDALGTKCKARRVPKLKK